MSDGFQYKNHNIYLTQQAYICDDGKHYQAHGESIDENEVTWEFQLIWEIIRFDCEAGEDESLACNWDDFEVIELGQAL